MSLYEKIINKEEKISLIGLGYVGMPIAVAFASQVDVIGFDPLGVFDRRAQTEENLGSLRSDLFEQPVGEGKIIRRGIVLIRVKVAEDIGYVNEIRAAVGSAAIVQTRSWNSEVFKKFKDTLLVIPRSLVVRSAVDTVKLLYLRCDFVSNKHMRPPNFIFTNILY